MNDQTRDYLAETMVKTLGITRSQANWRVEAFLRSGLIERYNLTNPDSKEFQIITDIAMHIPQLGSLFFTDHWEEHEPYFGRCEVEGCYLEIANGGCCWRDTGYWNVCSKHSREFRKGKPRPPMKQSAIDREKRRGMDGVLLNKS
jgi:hypothetical protein